MIFCPCSVGLNRLQMNVDTVEQGDDGPTTSFGNRRLNHTS